MAIGFGIGARMVATRNAHEVTQSSAAAMLEIADRTYKNYELEKRELPLSIAIKFCDRFNVDLKWLVYGKSIGPNDPAIALVKDTFSAVFRELQERKGTLSPTKAARIGGFVFTICLQKGTRPMDEVGQVFDLIDED